MEVKKLKKIKTQLLLKGDGFDIAFSSFIFDTKSAKFRERLNERRYTVSDTPETYRVINSWGDAGLLFDDKSRENGWRKFSFLELCWLQIIRELRGLGFGREKIQKLKECLFQKYTEDGSDKTYLLEYYLACVMSDIDVVVVVLSQGDGDIGTEDEYHASQPIFDLPATHIVISLNKVRAEITENLNDKIKNQKFYSLDETEAGVLSKIASREDLKEVNLIIKNGKIGRVNYKKQKVNPEETLNLIREALKEGGRKEITIKQENGEVVSFEQVDKT
jgi:DNA-binding transcriptional MerR regulator